MSTRLILGVVAVLVAAPQVVLAQTPAVADSAFMAGMTWRSVGPANMSGRVTDIEGVPGTKTFYVAGATSGIWKTINNGTTFRPVFDDERVISMGDLAIAPSDPETVWAGTGEEDSRNSISPGGGVYKSTDGGMTWELMGLEDTQAVGRIVIDPRDRNRVYVAALGHPWGHNEERGLYRTKDGGETWERVHYVSEKAGFVDLAMHPDDPDMLFATSWERVRGPWYLESGGPGSALWKSTDGGDTWTEVTGGGFPETEKGRIGIAIAQSDPDIMYAIVEAEDPECPTAEASEMGEAEAEAEEGQAEETGAEKAEAEESGADECADLHGSGLYRSGDGGDTWTFMNSSNTRPFYYSQVRVDPSDPDRVFWSSFYFSKDGGKTVGNAAVGVHVDHHAMWWDTADPDHIVVGNDGGIAVSWDKGGNYDFVNTMAMGQFYAVSYNMDVPYRVCGGLQDNYTWCGPSRRADGEIDNHMWYSIGGGDGFYAPQDPTDPDIVFGESQQGRIYWRNTATGERHSLQAPDWREETKALRDSIAILQGDDPEDVSADAQARIDALQLRVAADSAQYGLRFNWNTPLQLSPHDPQTLYIGSNKVLKWTYDTDEMEPLSGDLTYADPEKIEVAYNTTGGITRDVTGAENYATIVALAESPLTEGELYAGTDDGRVWRGPGSGEWIELTDRFEGVPPNTYVSRIEPSSHNARRFYVSFDGHRQDDYTPYVYATDDGGESFRSITSNLPRGGPDFVHVVREDPDNPNLLFVGTDVGVYVSTDRGGSWTKFMNGLPTVPVHDLKIHPREHELIAGTHGRSIWIADIAPLQQLANGALPSSPTVFAMKTAIQFGDVPVGGEFIAQRVFQGESADYGAEITYWVPESTAEELAEKAREEARERMAAAGGEEGAEGEAQAPEAEAAEGEAEVRREAMRARMAGARGSRQQGPQVQIAILDAAGDTVQTLTGPAHAGLNRTHWNLQKRAEREEQSPSERADSLRNIRLYKEVGDSLVTHEGANRQLVDRVIQLATGGDPQALRRMFGGGGGRGGGAGEATGWRERPGESYPEAGTGSGRAARPGGAGGPGGPGGFDPGEMRDTFLEIRSGMRARGANVGGFRGFGGGGGSLAAPGTYTVAVTIGDETYTTQVEVTRKDGFGFWDGRDSD
jgi:photosystem II stability/assembly factor-like uncharacterized protein